MLFVKPIYIHLTKKSHKDEHHAEYGQRNEGDANDEGESRSLIKR